MCILCVFGYLCRKLVISLVVFLLLEVIWVVVSMVSFELGLIFMVVVVLCWVVVLLFMVKVFWVRVRWVFIRLL